MNWDEVVLKLGPKLLNYFANSFRREIAKDLVQETLIRLVHQVQRKQFDSSRGSLQAYSFGIAYLVRLEQLRQTRKEQKHTDIDDVELTDPYRIEDVQNRLLIRKALQHLSDTEKEIVLLLINEDLKYEEISEILKLPLNTIRSHIFRAKQKMHEFLNKQEVTHG